MKTILLNSKKSITSSLQVLDNFSKIIAQKEYSITTADHAKYLVATGGVGPCLFIAVYHPKTKTAMGIHYDDNTQKEALMGALEVFLATTGGQINELEVAILGGYRSWPSSRENADTTVKFFKDLGITPDINGLFIDGNSSFLTEDMNYACTASINAKTGEVVHFAYVKLIEGAEEDARIKTCQQLDANFLQENHVPFSGTPLLPRDVFAVNDPLDQKVFAKVKLLCDAAKSNNYVELERQLKTGINPNIGIPPNGMTPLHFACLSNNAKTAGLIIQYGGDITIVDNAKRRPLDLLKDAAQRKNLVELFISEKKSRMERRLSKAVSNTAAAASATTAATAATTAAASANASAEAPLSAAGVRLAATANTVSCEEKTRIEKSAIGTLPLPSSSAAASNATPAILMTFSATGNAVKNSLVITPPVATPTAAASTATATIPTAASAATTTSNHQKKKKKKKKRNVAV